MASALYFVVHLGVLAAGNPEDAVATGVHQTYGDCGVKDLDLMGYVRVPDVCLCLSSSFCPLPQHK